MNDFFNRVRDVPRLTQQRAQSFDVISLEFESFAVQRPPGTALIFQFREERGEIVRAC